MRSEDTTPTVVEEELPLSAPEILPGNASLIVRYDLSDTSQKTAIQEAWAETTGTTPTIGGLIAGNPTLILKDPEVSEFFYVLSPGDTRFTLIAPITTYTTELLAQQTVVQAVEKNGWYIVHPLAVSTYITNIGDNPISGTGGLPELPPSTTTQWIVDPSTMDDVLSALPSSIASDIQANTFSAAYSGTGTQFIFTTNTTSLPTLGSLTTTPDPTSTAAASIYNLIPGDAEYIWSGDNMSAAIASGILPSTFNATTLNEPANSTLTSQLTGPYSYYTRTGPDGIEDIGFVIELPTTLKGVLKIGDPALESTITSLIQRITGSTASPSIAFSDNTYEGIPLRFVNLVDPTTALDYSVDDNYIYVSSSKEGMFTLLDTVRGVATPASQSSPWQALIESAPTAITGESTVLTHYDHPTLNNFLPPAATSNGLPVWLSMKPFGGSIQLQGIVALGQ